MTNVDDDAYTTSVPLWLDGSCSLYIPDTPFLLTTYTNIDLNLHKNRGVRPEQIFVGVGSDEAIDLIMRIFCVPGKDSIIITPPTYGMYKVSAKTNDVGIVSVPLTPTFEVRIPEVCMLGGLMISSVLCIYIDY